MKNKKGFTLIELIIYIAIIGLIMSSFVSFSIIMANSRNKNYAAREVQANFRNILDIVTRKVKEANSINMGASIFGSDPGVLSLSMDDPSKDPTIIDLDQDDGVMQITEGTSNPVAITSNEIQVTNLVFENLSGTSPRNNIRIQLTLEFNGEDNDQNFNYSEDFQTAISLRH